MRGTYRPTRSAGDQSGFSLIELLVTILIIGILAAIAIPLFLGQSQKADDASAKSNVTNLARAIERCRLDATSYAACDTEAELPGEPGGSWGFGPGQVGVLGASTNGFAAYAISKAETNGANHAFGWIKESDTVVKRECSDSSLRALNSGGCRDSKW